VTTAALQGAAVFSCLIVIAGLDPAIHLAKKMDARVEPAYDA
jgi:hypothetical protein